MKNIWNPWHGCKKKSEGCENCYMYYLDRQRDRDGGDIYKVKGDFDLPMKRDRDGFYKIRSGSRIVVCATSDFFLEEADEWRGEAWEMMRQRNDVEFVLFTKRPERIRRCLPDGWRTGWKNITISVTCENQRRTDERMPILIDAPVVHKEVMCTPLLSEIQMGKYLDSGEIEHVSSGGENYEGARPTRYEWHLSLYRQCSERGIPFEFFDTGAKFIKDGRMYSIPYSLRREQALKSGLVYPPIMKSKK